MTYHEVFGVRVWMCSYRNHPRIYENLYTGEKVEETELEHQRPDEGVQDK